MKITLSEFNLEILIAIGVPALGAMSFMIRHFWLKTKCFYLLKHRLEQLESEITRSKERDISIFNRLNSLDKNFSNISGKLDILILK